MLTSSDRFGNVVLILSCGCWDLRLAAVGMCDSRNDSHSGTRIRIIMTLLCEEKS